MGWFLFMVVTVSAIRRVLYRNEKWQDETTRMEQEEKSVKALCQYQDGADGLTSSHAYVQREVCDWTKMIVLSLICM